MSLPALVVSKFLEGFRAAGGLSVVRPSEAALNATGLSGFSESHGKHDIQFGLVISW